MPKGIFVTGAGGFLGRHLLPELRTLGRPVVALDGNLLDPDSYRSALGSCDVVVHLAARTGAASAAEHERVNARGTEVLLDACRSEGVPKILFVSSIATTFPPDIGYHYADAKRRAEGAVIRSGLKFTIVRPTVIAGPGSPNLKSLEKLALLPFIVVPGNGRSRVQPIDVSAAAEAIAALVRQDAFGNDVVELGGPKVLTMEEHLQEIRIARTGRSGRVIHVPLRFFSFPLRVAEALGLAGVLPVTAGQLSSFRFDGVTTEHRNAARPGFEGRDGNECRVFTQYLQRCEPDAYVVKHYTAATSTLGLTPSSSFDRALLAFARLGPLWTRLADSYASVFVRTSSLRKRLVLLLALLETRAPFHLDIDRSPGGSTPVLLARLSLTTVLAITSLLAATVVLAPVHAVLAMFAPSTRGARSRQER